MKEEIKPLTEEAKNLKLGIYEHFKGNRYKILSVARDSEDLEEKVVYLGLYGDNSVWVRPLKSFLEIVERDGKKLPRFKYIGE